MKSKWYKLKEGAIKLRKQGKSIRDVEKKLAIPRSTLSGWFRSVELSESKKEKLFQNWKNALRHARVKAAKWHNNQKKIRLIEAKRQAEVVLEKIDHNNKDVLDIALSFLYLGEGFKKTADTGMGNSDPLILKFFLKSLIKNYSLPISKIKCELHLRADQNIKEIKNYWSRQLRIPLRNFTTTSIDKRTIGKPTYPSYKGVCVLRCSNVAIQRKLVCLSNLFCNKIIQS